MFQIFAGRKER